MQADADTLRDELREIGERRERVGNELIQLARDTGKAINRARGTITMTEIAGLVRLDRTGLYRTYGTDG